MPGARLPEAHLETRAPLRLGRERAPGHASAMRSRRGAGGTCFTSNPGCPCRTRPLCGLAPGPAAAFGAHHSRSVARGPAHGGGSHREGEAAADERVGAAPREAPALGRACGARSGWRGSSSGGAGAQGPEDLAKAELQKVPKEKSNNFMGKNIFV